MERSEYVWLQILVQAMRKYLEFCPEHHISFSEKQEQIQSSINDDPTEDTKTIILPNLAASNMQLVQAMHGAPYRILYGADNHPDEPC